MIKHLVKIIWNQRRRNGWIAAEILLVFVVLWYIIDSLMAVGKVFFAPMGWDIDHVYWISMGVEEVDRNEMDSTYRYVTSGRSMLTAIDRIKTCPGVEAVGVGLMSMPHTGENRVEALIKEFRLEKVRKSMGIQLSGGERRRTEIARAVAINPAFILLDEPFAGVDPIAVEDIQSIVATLKNKNIGVIITDHNVDETLAITDRAYLLYEGKVLKTGSPEELAADPEVRKRYLGKHFELRRSPTIDRLRQQGAEAQRSVSETDAEATHE